MEHLLFTKKNVHSETFFQFFLVKVFLKNSHEVFSIFFFSNSAEYSVKKFFSVEKMLIKIFMEQKYSLKIFLYKYFRVPLVYPGTLQV